MDDELFVDGGGGGGMVDDGGPDQFMGDGGRAPPPTAAKQYRQASIPRGDSSSQRCAPGLTSAG